MSTLTATRAAGGLFGWWRAGDADARRALIAASLGWMLDAFDVMLYALVLASLMSELNIAKDVAGLLGSVTLVASAAGGMIFGVVADRFGRTRALMGSILIYSVFTAACGLAQSVWQLAVFRVLLGIGMGGEWAIGYAAAAVVTWLVMPVWGWRAVFFVGVLPAFFTIWVRRAVREPELWRRASRRTVGADAHIRDIFSGSLLPLTAAVTLMNACTMFAWWGFNLWIPAYLSLPAAEGGVGLSTSAMSGFIVAMQIGMWFGYVTFGFISDALGRRRTYLLYLCTAAVLILVYGATRNTTALLLLGPFVAFFGTGYFSGFGAVTAEIYPTSIRATAQGFTYNIGRVASAVAPFAVGSVAQTQGFGVALSLASAAFLLAAVMWIWIPETAGRELS